MIDICTQVVDDILDYVSSSEDLGKPGAGADLGAGLRTAPLLLAARNCSALARLLDLGEEVGSKEEVVRMVVEAGGVEEAAQMASAHADMALDALEGWEGEQAEELRDLVGKVIGQVDARYFCQIIYCYSSAMFYLSQVSTRIPGREGIIED